MDEIKIYVIPVKRIQGSMVTFNGTESKFLLRILWLPHT